MDILREILGRSGASLRTLHIEHISSCDRELLGAFAVDAFGHFHQLIPSRRYLAAQLISTCVPDLQQLTVIVPDATALELNNLELAGVLDSALAAPLLSVQ